MLVLTRKPGESIKLFVGSEEITVHLLDGSSHGQSRIGIEASSAVKILRSELIAGIEPNENQMGKSLVI